MERTGIGEIVSQPEVITSDKEAACILRHNETPYQKFTSQGSPPFCSREAWFSLEVTLKITPMIVQVRVPKDEPDYLNKLNDVPQTKKN